MANHYSGKRAAGRKPVGKRALSLLILGNANVLHGICGK